MRADSAQISLSTGLYPKLAMLLAMVCRVCSVCTRVLWYVGVVGRVGGRPTDRPQGARAVCDPPRGVPPPPATGALIYNSYIFYTAP